MIKQKVYLLVENLDQLDNLNMFCAWFIVLARYLFQSIVLLKPDSNCLRSFMFSWVDKIITGTLNLVSFIWKLGFWWFAVPDIIAISTPF